MDYMLGAAYFASVFVLTAVVAGVYSAAQEAWIPASVVVRRAFKRAFKLLGVLVVLALAVHFLSRI